MIRRSFPIATMLGLCLAATAAAQRPAASPARAVPVRAAVPAPAPLRQAAPPATVGPVLHSSAVTAPAAAAPVLTPADPFPPAVDKHQSEAMMIVGGAGLVVGAIIAGSNSALGALVMVGGGVVGLTGLYYYLQ